MPDRVISLTPEEVNRMLATGEMKILSTPSGIDYAQPEPDKPWPQTEEAQKLIDLGYTRKQAAFSPDEITDKTRVYAGPLVNKDNSGETVPIFEKLINAELILAPEGEIKIEELTIGGKPKKQLIKDMRKGNIAITGLAEDMIKSPYFTTLPNPEVIKTIKLKVQDLGFDTGAAIGEIYKQAELLGLRPCPAEAGLHLRLKGTNQPVNDLYWIGMKQIAGSNGRSSVFGLARRVGRLGLYGTWADPDDIWAFSREFVFSLRPSTDSTSTSAVSSVPNGSSRDPLSTGK